MSMAIQGVANAAASSPFELDGAVVDAPEVDFARLSRASRSPPEPDPVAAAADELFLPSVTMSKINPVSFIALLPLARRSRYQVTVNRP